MSPALDYGLILVFLILSLPLAATMCNKEVKNDQQVMVRSRLNRTVK